MMQIKVNGAARTLESETSVQGLTELLGLSATQIAIERNGEIVSRSLWNDVAVHDGDTIEIVRFVGGG